MPIRGTGFSVDPDALRSYGAHLGEAGTQVGQAHSGLAAAASLPSAALGSVGEESGFVAAYAHRLEQQAVALQSLGRALGECGTNARAAADAYVQNDAAHRSGIDAAPASI